MPFINEVLDHNRQHNRQAREQATSAGGWSRFAFDPEQLHRQLLGQLVGQDPVIDSLCQQLKVIKAGLSDPRRPLLVMLLLGDTGVGKTETVRALAQGIHGDPSAFCRIDMNTLSQSHYSAAITGAPPGYVGSKENTTLMNEEAIRGTSTRPGIVLFDEVEKASPDVARSLMNIFDSGRLRLASGTRELSFTNCLIFMTSNLGSRQWQSDHDRPWRRWFRSRQFAREQRFMQALRGHFDPEFLNRIDRVEIYRELGSGDIEAIVKLEVAALNQSLARKRVALELSEAAVRWLAQTGYDPRYGARAIRRRVRDALLVPVAEALLAGPGPTASADPGLLQVELTGGRLRCQRAAPPMEGI